jgi:uncharacterized membrane protein
MITPKGTLALPFILVLAILLLLIALLEVGVLGYAYEKVGVDRRYVSALLMLSLLGSYVNIPVARIPQIMPGVGDWPRTIVAVNLGGAVVPTLLSVYLVMKNGMYGSALVGVIVVAAVVHRLAQPVPGTGIAVPALIPPVAAAAVALLLARRSAPALAYVAGSLGTLIGGDLTNLGRLGDLGAPIAAIGGAGTFDGVFLSGIIAVLLA